MAAIDNVTPGAGLALAFGQHTTVAAADNVTTGLKTVAGCVAVLDDDPVDGAMWATVDVSAGTADGDVQINTWLQTDGDSTLVVATTFGKLVNWVAWGTEG